MLRTLIIWLLLTATAFAGEYVETDWPVRRYSDQFKNMIINLSWTEKGGHLYLHTDEGELYGTVNLRTGTIFINGRRILINGFCDYNAEGESVPFDMTGIRSLILTRME